MYTWLKNGTLESFYLGCASDFFDLFVLRCMSIVPFMFYPDGFHAPPQMVRCMAHGGPWGPLGRVAGRRVTGGMRGRTRGRKRLAAGGGRAAGSNTDVDTTAIGTFSQTN